MKNTMLMMGLWLIGLPLLHSQDWTHTLDSALQTAAATEVFQGQVLIGQNRQVVFQKSYGHDRLIIEDHTPLSIQSVTKAFTAIGILRLVEDGQLALNDPLIKYLPKLPYEQVLISHLLNMNSGLPRFFETALKHGDTTKVMSNPEIIDLIALQKPTAEAPGGPFAYNNTNYLLLASVIEKVSGVDYATFIKSRIIDPLGMNHTSIAVPGEENGPVGVDNFYQPYGEGNIYSTAGDLFKLDQALTSGQIIAFIDHLNEQMRKAGQGNTPEYLLGWWLRPDERGLQMRIIGDGQNTRSVWQRYLNGDRSIIYLHSSSVNYQEQVFEALLNIIEGRPYQLPEKRTPYQIDPQLLHQYTGSYLSEVFGLLHVTAENGELFLRPDPVPDSERLVPSSDTTFYFEGQPVEWEFFLDDQGGVLGFGLKGKREQMGKRQD